MAAPKRILLVDDNPVNLSVLRAMLGREDYELIAATSGRAAQDLAVSNPNFDLILLDVSMPDVNGIDVCRFLRNHPETEHIPIVLLSAVCVDDDSIQEGLRAGADGYLTKPLDETALRTWVRATLRISALEHEVTALARAGLNSDSETILEEIAGLSHRVNNALQALYASAELLGLQVDGNERALHLIADILEQTENAATMVTQASMAAREFLRRQSAAAAHGQRRS